MLDEDALWPFRPALLEDETFTSWFARLSEAQALHPSELYRSVLPGSQLCGRDLDRVPPDPLITELVRHTGQSGNELRDATLDRFRGTLIEADDGICKLPWLPPAGTYLSKASFGQQVCPACLAEDSEPYLRLTWRLAFVTCCPKHGTPLLDRCPSCGASILRLRHHAGLCHKCGTAFRFSPRQWLDDEDLAFQAANLRVLEEGWAELGAYGSVMSLIYFRVLSLLFRLVATGRHAIALRRAVAANAGEASLIAGVPRLRELEHFNPEGRRLLLRVCGRLLEGWPDRFVTECRRVRLPRWQLVRDDRDVPFAYWDPIARHLATPFRTVGREELQAAKDVIRRRGQRPGYVRLRELLGSRFVEHRDLAEPDPGRARFGEGRYWKLDGVSAEIRTAARMAAHRQGENVGRWVEKALRQVLYGTAT